MKPSKIKIWYLERYSAEELADNYIEFIKRQKEEANYDYTSDNPTVQAVFNQSLESISKLKKFNNLPNPTKSVSVKKFHLLIHHLISRNGGDNNTLNSKVLQEIYGSNYNWMLRSLVELNIITISPFYVPGKESYTYTLNPSLSVYPRDEYNHYVIKQVEKLENIFDEYNEQIYLSNLNDKFKAKYDKNLSLLKPERYDIENYIYKLPKPDRAKVVYYETINKISKKRNVCKLDDRNRVYSVLSRTPKLLKNFLNIKFSIDTKNSQPLLFSYFIINKYNIPFSIVKELYSIPIHGNTHSHYVGNNFCKSLSIKSQEVVEKSGIPDDALRYIFVTIHGIFWEDFKLIDQFSHIPRGELKIRLFREVFFSKRTGWWKGDLEREFVKIYPNVYDFIMGYRIGFENGKNEHVAHLITRLESEIFHEILEQLWNMGQDVLNIHDAVVLLNTPTNKDISEKDVNEVIISVYEKYNLIPTCSTDYFSIEQAEMELEELLENKEKVDEYYLKINHAADNPEDPDHEFYYELREEVNKGRKTVGINDGKITVY